MRITEEQYRRLTNAKTPRLSKYNNRKVTYGGHVFDSAKEGAYYLKLQLMQDAGIIRDLELQKKFVLQDRYILNGKEYREISYIADFCYISTKDNKMHVVDVKGYKTDVYRLKKKLFEYKYRVEIEEV